MKHTHDHTLVLDLNDIEYILKKYIEDYYYPEGINLVLDKTDIKGVAVWNEEDDR